MALPELPDDRRASPRRFDPAEPPVSVRHRAEDGAPRPGQPSLGSGEAGAEVPGLPATNGPPNGTGAQVNGAPNGHGPSGHGPSGHGPNGRPNGPNGAPPAHQGPPSGPDTANGRPLGDGRRAGSDHTDAALPGGGPRRPSAAHRGSTAESGGGARAVPPPGQVPPGQVPPGPLPAPRHAGEARPRPGGLPSGERTAAIRPPATPPGPGGFGPDDEPTEVMRVGGARQATRPGEGHDLDATDVIGSPVRDDVADPAVPDPSATGETAPPDNEPGAGRRARRQSGETAGSRPGAEYKKQAEALSRKKPRTGRRRRPAFWRELPLLVVVALLLTFLIQTFLAKVYVIPSGSMELTLHGCPGCNNDRVLVDKVTYRFTDPQPGDVVVFRGPDSWSSEVSVAPPSNALVAGLQQLGSLIGIAPPDEKDFVKRIIAVGGQTVQCCDSRNRIMVDGQPLDEPYVYYLPGVGPPRQEAFGPITVPQDQLWMMGDSRNNSSDSRVPGHGPVPVENIIGKARLIVLPIDRFGWIDPTNPQGGAAVGMGTMGTGAPLALGALLAVPLLRRGRRSLASPDAHDRFTGFLPDHRRWR